MKNIYIIEDIGTTEDMSLHSGYIFTQEEGLDVDR